MRMGIELRRPESTRDFRENSPLNTHYPRSSCTPRLFFRFHRVAQSSQFCQVSPIAATYP
jgi:hypothetical protein